MVQCFEWLNERKSVTKMCHRSPITPPSPPPSRSLAGFGSIVQLDKVLLITDGDSFRQRTASEARGGTQNRTNKISNVTKSFMFRSTQAFATGSMLQQLVRKSSIHGNGVPKTPIISLLIVMGKRERTAYDKRRTGS